MDGLDKEAWSRQDVGNGLVVRWSLTHRALADRIKLGIRGEMSWLSKVTDLAGKAEEMLVKMDQNTGQAIREVKQKKSASTASLNRPDHTSLTITEEVGRAEPSHAHSDFVKPQRMKQPTAGYAPSTSVLPEQRDANLISFLNDPDADEMETGRSACSTHSVTEAADLVLLNTLRSQLSAKDSQIAVLKARTADLERRVEEERAKAKKSTEKVEEKKENASHESLAKERNTLLSDLSNMKKRVMSLEEQLSAVNDQLRLAKFNLTENKKEFDEYKTKAQKILVTKEKLIDSLKAESGGEEKSNNILLAQLEELKLERDLARSDLESAQVHVYNMRAEADEAESAAREARHALAELKKRVEEERDSWQMNHGILRERADCARSEVEVLRAELEKERAQWQRRLDEKEGELMRWRDERRERTTPVDDSSGSRTTMLLLQKEEELREALRDKQILAVRLERLMSASRETAVTVGGGGGGEGAVAGGMVGGASSGPLQATVLKGVSLLRGSSTARAYFAGYLFAVHLLLFLILLTYTPEAHSSDYMPADPAHDRG